jgi:hypothetical protein
VNGYVIVLIALFVVGFALPAILAAVQGYMEAREQSRRNEWMDKYKS